MVRDRDTIFILLFTILMIHIFARLTQCAASVSQQMNIITSSDQFKTNQILRKLSSAL